MAPSALGPSLPDIDSPVRKSLDPVGTPRRSGSLASTANTMYSHPPSNHGGSRTASRMSTQFPSDDASAADLWTRYNHIKDTDVAKNTLLEVRDCSRDISSATKSFEIMNLARSMVMRSATVEIPAHQYLTQEVITRYAYLQQTHNNYLQATEQQLADNNARELSEVRRLNSQLVEMLVSAIKLGNLRLDQSNTYPGIRPFCARFDRRRRHDLRQLSASTWRGRWAASSESPHPGRRRMVTDQCGRLLIALSHCDPYLCQR